MTRADASASRPRLFGMRGFSQIEVLVAMLIIGLATPYLLGGIIGSLTRARSAQDQGAATAWVQGEVDYLRRMCYDRLGPSTRKVTPLTVQGGEPQLPQGFAAAFVQLEPAGPANLRATVSLYKADWNAPVPSAAPALSTSTYIGDIRVATLCP
jgi:type II secretory pathway pseudopilin PulG